MYRPISFAKPETTHFETPVGTISHVRSLAKQLIEVGRDERLLVTELRCSDGCCAPIETVITVVPAAGDPALFKIPIPASEVTADHVLGVAAALAQWRARQRQA